MKMDSSSCVPEVRVGLGVLCKQEGPHTASHRGQLVAGGEELIDGNEIGHFGCVEVGSVASLVW